MCRHFHMSDIFFADNCRYTTGRDCKHGACLNGQCHCNDGYGGKGCDMPDDNECKYRPCDVFGYCTNTLGSFFCRSVKWIKVLSKVL